MDLIAGAIISLRHYSKNEPLKSIILDTANDSFKIRITEEFAASNCLVGDHVVAIYEHNGKLCSLSCIISNINPVESEAVLEIEHIEITINHRKQNRYFVSFYAMITVIDANNTFIASVRDISINGMMICCKCDFPLEQKLAIELHIFDSIVFSEANVMWKLQDRNNFKYGLQIGFNNQKDKILLEQYLNNLKIEQDAFIKRKIKLQ